MWNLYISDVILYTHPQVGEVPYCFPLQCSSKSPATKVFLGVVGHHSLNFFTMHIHTDINLQYIYIYQWKQVIFQLNTQVTNNGRSLGYERSEVGLNLNRNNTQLSQIFIFPAIVMSDLGQRKADGSTLQGEWQGMNESLFIIIQGTRILTRLYLWEARLLLPTWWNSTGFTPRRSQLQPLCILLSRDGGNSDTAIRSCNTFLAEWPSFSGILQGRKKPKSTELWIRDLLMLQGRGWRSNAILGCYPTAGGSDYY